MKKKKELRKDPHVQFHNCLSPILNKQAWVRNKICCPLQQKIKTKHKNWLKTLHYINQCYSQTKTNAAYGKKDHWRRDWRKIRWIVFYLRDWKQHNMQVAFRLVSVHIRQPLLCISPMEEPGIHFSRWFSGIGPIKSKWQIGTLVWINHSKNLIHENNDVDNAPEFLRQ